MTGPEDEKIDKRKERGPIECLVRQAMLAEISSSYSEIKLDYADEKPQLTTAFNLSWDAIY